MSAALARLNAAMQTGPAAAAVWMTIAAVIFTGMIICVRLLADKFSIFEIAFFRTGVGIVVLLPVIFRLGVGHMRTERLPLYGLRAVMGYGGMCSYYIAISRIDIVDATTLNTTVPLWVTLLAWLFLGERVGRRRVILTLVGFAGALILLRPGAGTFSLWAAIGFGGAGLYAVAVLCIKSLSRTEPTSRLVMYMNLFIFVIALPLAIWTWVTPDWADAPYILGVGVCSTVAHYCFGRACAAADASVVVPFDFMRLPFAAVAGYFVFFMVPDVWTGVGALVIFVSVYLMARTEARKARAASANADEEKEKDRGALGPALDDTPAPVAHQSLASEDANPGDATGPAAR